MTQPDLGLYKQAFLNTEHPAIITDTNYVMRDVNDACVEFTGYSREELIGNVPLMLFSNPRIYEDALETLEADQSWEGFFEAETKGGDLVYGRGSVIPLSVDGEKQGYSAFFVDLTERRRYEQTNKVIHRVLRHDLRNEMNLVSGYAATVASEVTDEDVLEKLEKLQEVSDRLIRRSEKARELEQVLYEGFEQPLRPVELDGVLRAEIDRARDQYDVEVDVGEIPRVDVVANDMLGTVFETVLDNAVRHNDDEPHVEVSVRRTDDRVVVRIADDGPGIRADQQDQIFGWEENSQVDHGKGFGLYFVDLVVDTFGGGVAVADGDLAGAAFDISLVTAD